MKEGHFEIPPQKEKKKIKKEIIPWESIRTVLLYYWNNILDIILQCMTILISINVHEVVDLIVADFKTWTLSYFFNQL